MAVLQVFIAAAYFLLVTGVGASLHCGVQASHCAGFSCLWTMGSRAHGLRDCDSRAQLACGMWDPRWGSNPCPLC